MLELVEGPTLAARLAHGRLGVRETLIIARQIADAVEAAHEQGIIHRDLKPANVKVRGTSRRILEARQGMRWSPDGRRIAYIKPGGSHGDSLLLADADGQHERELVKQEAARHLHWARWSPDGRHLYFNYGFANGNAEPTDRQSPTGRG